MANASSEKREGEGGREREGEGGREGGREGERDRERERERERESSLPGRSRTQEVHRVPIMDKDGRVALAKFREPPHRSG